MKDGFLRMDENPGAVVNNDSTGLKAYKLAKQRAKQQNDEINTLKTEVSELKQMLTQLLEKLDK